MPAFVRTYKNIFTGLALLLLLIGLRVVWTGTLRFAFLSWNLFLAVLPLLFSYLLGRARDRRVAFGLAALWLLFFPNAAYLLTDIVHLRRQDSPRYWLDLVLLFTAGAYGVYIGLRSLRQVEDWYGQWLKGPLKAILTFVLLLGCGYGMYLGRVERWNSWDVVAQPLSLLQDIYYDARHPWRSREAWLMTGVFAVGLQLLYLLQGSQPDRRKLSSN